MVFGAWLAGYVASLVVCGARVRVALVTAIAAEFEVTGSIGLVKAHPIVTWVVIIMVCVVNAPNEKATTRELGVEAGKLAVLDQEIFVSHLPLSPQSTNSGFVLLDRREF